MRSALQRVSQGLALAGDGFADLPRAALLRWSELFVPPVEPSPPNPLPSPPETVTATPKEAAAPEAAEAPATATATVAGASPTLSNGILLDGDRAIQLFGGTPAGANAYARIVNDFAARLPGVRVHSVVAPTSVSLHLPAHAPVQTRSEEENLHVLDQALAPGITRTDVLANLKRHQGEPLFLRTDHHWNGLGAYYAYEAFCRTLGVEPAPLAGLTHLTKERFLGSLYAFTGEARLRARPDTLDIYVPPVSYQATRQRRTDGRIEKARFVEPGLGGYMVFLGGDHAVMTARVDNAPDPRHILVVKNSYANPFTVLLLATFSRVIVVDYRYFAGDLSELVRKEQVTDLVMFNVTMTVNSAPHRRRLEKLAAAIASPGQRAQPLDASGP
jgi:hypothetical protein